MRYPRRAIHPHPQGATGWERVGWGLLAQSANDDYSGTAGNYLSIHAWDQTSGSPGDTTADASSKGGATAYSTNEATASITVDDAPEVSSIERANGEANPTNADSIQFTIRLTKSVSGVDSSDVTVTQVSGDVTGVVSEMKQSGDSYNVSVGSITGSGDLRLDLIDDDSISAADSGVPLGGVGTSGAPNGSYTNGEMFTFERTPPTFEAGGSNSASVDEGTTGDVLDVNADDDGGTNYDTDVTYSLGGTDTGSFSIDGDTGQITLDSALDYDSPSDADGNNDYELTVTATDDAGNTNELQVTVNVLSVRGGGGSGGGDDDDDDGSGGYGGSNSGSSSNDETTTESTVETTVTRNGTTNVTIANVDPGTEISIDTTGTASENGSVALDSLSLHLTNETNGSVSLNVSVNATAPADSPRFGDSDNGALGYIEVDHSVSDESIGKTTFRFILSSDRLDERSADPEDVVLFRHHNDSWNALNTTYVGQNGTNHSFEAESPGLSMFAIGTADSAPNNGTESSVNEPSTPTPGVTTELEGTDQSTTTESPAATATTSQSGPGFGVPVAILGALGASLLLRRRRFN